MPPFKEIPHIEVEMYGRHYSILVESTGSGSDLFEFEPSLITYSLCGLENKFLS